MYLYNKINYKQVNSKLILVNKLFFNSIKQLQRYFKKKELNKSGRSKVTGKKTIFSKKSKILNNKPILTKIWLNSYFLIKYVYYSRILKKFLSKIYYPNGIQALIPTVEGALQGDINYSHPSIVNTTKFLIGDRIPNHCLKNSLIISNLEIVNKLTKKTRVYATSPGTYIKVKMIKFDTGEILIELPSKKQKVINHEGFSRIGKNFGFFLKQALNNRAGFYKNLGKNSKVRGIAKNACDHPNGGNTNKKKMWKTPWGKNAKLNK